MDTGSPRRANGSPALRKSSPPAPCSTRTGTTRTTFAARRSDSTTPHRIRIVENATTYHAVPMSCGAGWWKAAACRGVRVETFFPEHMMGEAVADALDICRSCRVRVACLDAALAEERVVAGEVL